MRPGQYLCLLEFHSTPQFGQSCGTIQAVRTTRTASVLDMMSAQYTLDSAGWKTQTYVSQYDDGSCLSTLDADCVEAVQRQAEDSAMQLVG
jgi:hypothetical protein